MKFKSAAAALPFIACVGLALAAAAPSVDSITKLPVPLTGTPFVLRANPMKIDDFGLCKSTVTMNFYTAQSGQVDAAVSWFAGHLTGFKHSHGYGSGRSQDIFYNSAGTLMVSVTGGDAPQGENTKVFAVNYAGVKPGASEKALIGLNTQHIDCR